MGYWRCKGCEWIDEDKKMKQQLMVTLFEKRGVEKCL